MTAGIEPYLTTTLFSISLLDFHVAYDFRVE